MDTSLFDMVTDQWKPSKKRLVISPQFWRDFGEGVEELGEELKEEGLLKETLGRKLTRKYLVWMAPSVEQLSLCFA